MVHTRLLSFLFFDYYNTHYRRRGKGLSRVRTVYRLHRTTIKLLVTCLITMSRAVRLRYVLGLQWHIT